MKLVTIKGRIKYKGERYYPNVPFDLDVDEFPSELVGLVEEYTESMETKSQFQSPRRAKNIEEVEETSTKKKRTRKTKNTPSTSIVEESTLDDLNLGNLEL